MASPEEQARGHVLNHLRGFEVSANKQRWDQGRAPRGYWWFHQGEIEEWMWKKFRVSRKGYRERAVATVQDVLESMPGVSRRYPSPSEQDIGSGLVPSDYEKWWVLNAHEYRAWRKSK